MKGIKRYPQPECSLWRVVNESEKLGAGTKRVYQSSISAWIEYAGENPSGWSLAQAQTWYKLMCTTMEPRSANGRIAALKYASRRWAALEGRPELDFANAVETRRDDGGRMIRSLNFDEAERLLVACRGQRPTDLRDLAAVTLGLRTGMRRMSIVDVKLDKFEMTANGTQIEVTIKGGRLHKVPVDATTLRAMDPWIQFLKKKGITSGPLFRGITLHGVSKDALSMEGLWKTLRRRARKAGIHDFSPHVLRHTFVTWCREAGVPDYQIAAVTGHKGGNGLERILGVYTDKSVGRSAIEAIPTDLWEP